MDKEIEGIVEIGSKDVVERRASATGVLNLSEASAQAIQNKTVKKGDILEASTIAAIQAVKRRNSSYRPSLPPDSIGGLQSSVVLGRLYSALYGSCFGPLQDRNRNGSPYRCVRGFTLCTRHGQIN